MSIGKLSDFKVYDELVHSGISETLQQNDEFLRNNNGVIRVVAMDKIGDYEKESFFASIAAANLVTRQDLTSTAAATDNALTQGENIRVKLHRRIGPIAQAHKAFKMQGSSAEELSLVIGRQVGKALTEEMLNRGLAAARAALANTAAVTNDITGATVKTVTHTTLLNTLRKMGDAQARVKAWIMHSESFFDLNVQAIADQVDTVASGVITIFNVPGLGRPIYVTDSASLIATGDTPDSYYVLGLTENAIQLVESEQAEVMVDKVSGLEQLVTRIQGETAFNLGLKGYTWDAANGGSNPSDAAVATGSNWDASAASTKDGAGVVLKSQRLSDQS
jgi:hypothetical protein